MNKTTKNSSFDLSRESRKDREFDTSAGQKNLNYFNEVRFNQRIIN